MIEMPPVENPEPNPEEADEHTEESLPPGTAIDQTASKEQLERSTGQRGQRKESALGFFARLPKYPPSDWERLKLYLYRLAPITDRTAGGNPVKFLTIYREAIDEEMVLKEWGSGKYRCLLNRMQEKGESIPIDRVEFEIENLNFPPKVPPGEWVDDPRNRRWAWANAKDEASKSSTPATPSPPAGPTLGEIVTAVKGIADMTRANQPAPPPKEESPFAKIDLVGLMEKTQAANNPSAILAAAKEIAAIAKPEKSGDSELLLKLIDKLIPAASNPGAAVAAPDPVAQLKTYADMAKTMREAFGPGEKEAEVIAQSRMNGWQEFTNGIVTAVAPGLNKMAEIFGTFMVMKMQMDLRNQQQGQQPQQPQPARAASPAIQQPQPMTQPQTQAGAPPQQPPTPPAAPAAAEPEQPPMNPQQAEMQMKIHAALSAIDYAMPTLLDHLNMDPEEIDVTRGWLFAQWFWAAKLPTRLPLQPLIVGSELLKGLKQFPPETLIQIIQMNAPAMYEALVPTPDKAEALLEFIKEFLAYDPEAEPEPNGGKK